MQATAPIKLYRSVVSGRSHRAELFLSLLGLPYTVIDIEGLYRVVAFLRNTVDRPQLEAELAGAAA